MTIEVGMYVRTKKGLIGKVTEINKHDLWGYLIKIEGQYYCYTHSSNKSLSDVIKASHNIIDLIENGDYVNGHQVVGIGIDDNNKNVELYIATQGYDELVLEQDIKSIVTKEQFNNMSYEVDK